MIQIREILQISCSFNCFWTAWCLTENHATVIIYCDYIISWKPRSRSHRLQRNQLKARDNIFLFFLPRPVIKPRIFQYWVFCLALWAITHTFCSFLPHYRSWSRVAYLASQFIFYNFLILLYEVSMHGWAQIGH